MPQEPFFLPDGNTFLSNLDPYEKASTTDCEDVLRDVGLLQLVQERDGLEGSMKHGSLSEGQKQLFSVARAVLRARWRARLGQHVEKGKRSGILLLDEITSSVDVATDNAIQKIIREEFEGYTIIAIAHRTETVSDFDRVVIMQDGRIKEVGAPTILPGMMEETVEKRG
jgi:ATP-binding cassette subfamily C (CFTR/MRP) protein 1